MEIEEVEQWSGISIGGGEGDGGDSHEILYFVFVDRRSLNRDHSDVIFL